MVYLDFYTLSRKERQSRLCYPLLRWYVGVLLRPSGGLVRTVS
jgi:hypothetical protein